MAKIAKPNRQSKDHARKRAKFRPALGAVGKTFGKRIEEDKTPHGTKLAAMISLLSRRQGATIVELVETTGWQRHSIRGAISGTLKKKIGLTVTSEAVDHRGRVYRIFSAN